MNALTDKSKYTPEEEAHFAALADRVLKHKEQTGDSWDDLYRKTGIKVSTLQAFASGKYNGRKETIAADVEKWFRNADVMAQLFDDADWGIPHLPTRTSREIQAILSHAKKGYINQIVGHPGLGKSATLENFQREHTNVWMITCSPAIASYNAVLAELLLAFGMAAGKRSASGLTHAVRQRLKHAERPLLIIDEAQHASDKALEELRAIHDYTKAGIVLCGNPEVVRNVEGNMTNAFAQRSSRLGYKHNFTVPYPEDVKMILDAWNVEDAQERKVLTEVAMKLKGGALRQLTKCLEAANMLAKGDNNSDRNIVHITSAIRQMSAGSLS